jgi:hypothetical protein
MGCCTPRQRTPEGSKFENESYQCIQVLAAERQLGVSYVEVSHIVDVFHTVARDTCIRGSDLNVILCDLRAKKYDKAHPSRPESKFYNQFASKNKLESRSLLAVFVLLSIGPPETKAHWLFCEYRKAKANSMSAKEIQAFFTELFESSLKSVVLAETSDNAASLAAYKDKLRQEIPRAVTALMSKFIGSADEICIKDFIEVIEADEEAAKIVSMRGLRSLLMNHEVRPSTKGG